MSEQLPPTRVPAGVKMMGQHEGQERWDEQLQKRSGNYGALHELGHYMLILGYVFQRGSRPVSILDLGCGGGLLFELVEPYLPRVTRYHGVDLSPWGIEQARKRFSYPNVAFETADIYTYAPPEKFDRIVFSESLQFIEEPVKVVRRYAQYLTDDGAIVTSVLETENRRPADFWLGAEEHFTFEDVVSLRNNLAEITWNVRLLRPRRG